MKINHKILNIPPHISTAWKNVDSIFLQEENGQKMLVIVLKKATSVIKIPNLDKKILDDIFSTHASFLENEASLDQKKTPPIKGSISFGLPIGEGVMPNNLEAFTSAMQHNPNQADAPELPKEILEKIASVAKILGDDSAFAMPEPHPNCNCVHCQIARAIHGEKKLTNEQRENLDEEVKDEELRFRTWDIKEISDKLYAVTNPLDKNEQYQVFLGKPLGCTCGDKNCEHIRAVLNT